MSKTCLDCIIFCETYKKIIKEDNAQDKLKTIAENCDSYESDNDSLKRW